MDTSSPTTTPNLKGSDPTPETPTGHAVLVPPAAAQEVSEPPTNWEKREKVSATMANYANLIAVLAAIIGLIIGYQEYQEAQRAEKNRVAMELMREARSPEFLARLRRLLIVSEPMKGYSEDSLRQLFAPYQSPENLLATIKDQASQGLFDDPSFAGGKELAQLGATVTTARQKAYANAKEAERQSAADFDAVYRVYDHVALLHNQGIARSELTSRSLTRDIRAFQQIMARWPYLTMDFDMIRLSEYTPRSVEIERMLAE